MEIGGEVEDACESPWEVSELEDSNRNPWQVRRLSS
jgi:hypothetical protein